MLFECRHGCSVDIGMTKAKQGLHRCDPHDAVLTYTKSLGSKPSDPGKPRKRSTLKQGKGFSASPAQRKAVRNKPCVYCAQCQGIDIGDGGGVFVVDPAHLWPRGMGGCDDALCVIPLCRAHHRLFDEGKLDILAKLIDGGYYPEMAHAIQAHELSPLTLLERLTGTEWAPLGSPERAVVR
jgi:hypothetical protein